MVTMKHNPMVSVTEEIETKMKAFFFHLGFDKLIIGLVMLFLVASLNLLVEKASRAPEWPFNCMFYGIFLEHGHLLW